MNNFSNVTDVRSIYNNCISIYFQGAIVILKTLLTLLKLAFKNMKFFEAI